MLDYGCGKGWLGRTLSSRYAVVSYDPAVPAFSALPGPADFIVCWDVMEHVEPELLGAVLDHLAGLAPAVYFAIGLVADSTRPMPDGRNPHLIQQPPEWWLPHLRSRWPRLVGTFNARSLEAIARHA